MVLPGSRSKMDWYETVILKLGREDSSKDKPLFPTSNLLPWKSLLSEK